MIAEKQYHAFDYKAQQWIEGEPARQLLIGQAKETLALLQGPHGEDYAQAMGVHRQKTMREIKQELVDLGA